MNATQQRQTRSVAKLSTARGVPRGRKVSPSVPRRVGRPWRPIANAPIELPLVKRVQSYLEVGRT
jgi:hypothetical protein